jgi:hypothetical protein
MTEALAAIELADLRRTQGRGDEARALRLQAETLVQGQADRPELVVTLLELGEAALADGEPARALPPLTRAQRLAGGGRAARSSGFALARAWWEAGEQARGLWPGPPRRGDSCADFRVAVHARAPRYSRVRIIATHGLRHYRGRVSRP